MRHWQHPLGISGVSLWNHQCELQTVVPKKTTKECNSAHHLVYACLCGYSSQSHVLEIACLYWTSWYCICCFVWLTRVVIQKHILTILDRVSTAGTSIITTRELVDITITCIVTMITIRGQLSFSDEELLTCAQMHSKPSAIVDFMPQSYTKFQGIAIVIVLSHLELDINVQLSEDMPTGSGSSSSLLTNFWPDLSTGCSFVATSYNTTLKIWSHRQIQRGVGVWIYHEGLLFFLEITFLISSAESLPYWEISSRLPHNP